MRRDGHENPNFGAKYVNQLACPVTLSQGPSDPRGAVPTLGRSQTALVCPITCAPHKIWLFGIGSNLCLKLRCLGCNYIYLYLARQISEVQAQGRGCVDSTLQIAPAWASRHYVYCIVPPRRRPGGYSGQGCGTQLCSGMSAASRILHPLATVAHGPSDPRGAVPTPGRSQTALVCPITCVPHNHLKELHICAGFGIGSNYLFGIALPQIQLYIFIFGSPDFRAVASILRFKSHQQVSIVQS